MSENIPQRSALHTAKIRPRREREVWGWSDGDLPLHAVQTAGFGTSLSANPHGIRRKGQRVRPTI